MQFLNVSHLLTTYGYIGIFAVVLIESGIFFFLPGDSLLFTAGLLAANGSMNLFLILVLALVAGFFGNLIGYWIGVHIESLKKYRMFRGILHDDHITKAQAFFGVRGRSALLLGRFVPGVRTFVPWVAGVAQMNKKMFIEWSAFGAVLWVGVMTLAGYFLGKAFPGLEKYLTEIILGVIVVSILPAIFEWWRSRSQKAGPPVE